MVKSGLGEASFLDDLLNTDSIIPQFGKELAGGLQDDESVVVHKRLYTARYRMCQGVKVFGALHLGNVNLPGIGISRMNICNSKVHCTFW